MYNTVDSISSQLVILHMPGVIYMPSRNGPEHIYELKGSGNVLVNPMLLKPDGG